jgi:uncharacterized protein
VSRALVYLHGFASSPRSSKARYFGERAAAAGLAFAAPDLNLPEFRTMTVTRMLDRVDEALADLEGPVALVGSSLGAFVAVHAAARQLAKAGGSTPRIDRLVLLAPALDLVPSLERELGDAAMSEWERSDSRPVFHFAENRPRELSWAFMADARRYDTDAIDLPIPVLVYQGTRDIVVSADAVRRWASGRPSVRLHLVNDDHQLLAHMDAMWHEMVRFLEVDG